MRSLPAFMILAVLLLAGLAHAARQHTIVFGKPMPVKWYIGPTEDKILPLQIRTLFVDGRIKEFTIGEARDITDSLFVVRRAYRLNDARPAESGARKPPEFRWQRGGWLLVDRATGRISRLNLPDFDPFYSVASWYRDFVAYCGLSDDGEKSYAVVAQLGRKKPLVRKELGAASQSDIPDSECPAPQWERQPSRVTFEPRTGAKLNFIIHGHAADAVSVSEE